MPQLVEASARLDDRGVRALVEALLDRVESNDRFWESLNEWWVARQNAWFDSGEIAANHPATVRLKDSSQPLVDTGQLKASTVQNQPFHSATSGATFGLRKGTASYRKAVLNLAGPRGAPSRSAVKPIDGDDVSIVRDILRDYIMETAREMSL